MKFFLVFANFTELDGATRTNISLQPQQFLHSAVSAPRPPCNIHRNSRPNRPSLYPTNYINIQTIFYASSADDPRGISRLARCSFEASRQFWDSNKSAIHNQLSSAPYQFLRNHPLLPRQTTGKRENSDDN